MYWLQFRLASLLIAFALFAFHCHDAGVAHLLCVVVVLFRGEARYLPFSPLILPLEILQHFPNGPLRRFYKSNARVEKQQ